MKIEPFLGQLEDAYRQEYLPADRMLITYVAVPWVVLTLFFIRSDGVLFGYSQLFFTLLLTRSTYAILTIGMLLSLWRFPQPRLYDRLVLIWTIVTVLHMSWIEFVRPSTYVGHYTLDVLVITVLYLVPNRLMLRTLGAALFSGLVLANLLVAKTSLQQVERDAIITACLVANVIGLVASTRLFTYRRQQFKALAQAQQATSALEILAITDPLTAVFNRRKFIELGGQQFKHFARYRHPFSVALIDLDLFKQVNDRFGHQAGDETLKQFSQLVLRHKRETDSFGRLGGEEFGLLLPDTPLAAAALLSDRLRRVVQDTPIIFKDTQLSITVSVGIAEVHGDDNDFDMLLSRADRLLYQAKHNGRNRVES